MQQHILANILFEQSWQFYRAPALYCSCNAPVYASKTEPGAWTLSGPGTFDFTTFFNALSTSKWLRYSSAESFFLHLEIKGAASTYTQTRADTYSWDAEELPETERTIATGEEWTELDIPIVLNEDVLVGFVIKAKGKIYIRNSYYYTEVPETSLRDVELALCTTTFKNEDYILPNIAAIKANIIDSDCSLAQHFNLHIVDNGRTLDKEAIESTRIHVHPNPNAGGSGGFARGMIEALEQQPKATHVLLMDDDVRISTESILRTYNLLRIVNEGYKEAFLGGAMMDLDTPNVRYEDVGFVACEGKYFPMKPKAYVDTLRDCIENEAYLKPKRNEPFREDRATQAYAAWWYCVIPVTVIERVGLPLPVFIRTDDVEYSLRARAKLMTMNSICVWHSPFEKRYSAAVERYQMVRNVLIGRFVSGMAPLADFLGAMKVAFELELKKYNYTNAELILDGFEDFLKGPEFISRPGSAEQAYLAHLKKEEKLVPLDELHDQALSLGVDLKAISALALEEGGVASDHRRFIERFRDNKTVNGHLHVRKGSHPENGVGIIGASGWLYPVDSIRNKEYIIAIDPIHKKGVIRRIDRERFKILWNRFHRDMLTYRTSKDELEKRYSAARETLTSISYWKHYLGID